jgi:cobalt-zinc-cadmium efflux system outer membrane protein
MRWLLCASVIAVLSGCQAHYLDIDGQIAQRAAQPIDALPSAQQAPETAPFPPRPMEEKTVLPGAIHRGLLEVQPSELPAKDGGLAVVQQEAVQPAKKNRDLLDRLRFPDTIIGKIADIQLPATAPPKEIAAAIKQQFPELPKLPRLPEPRAGPDGRPMTLADLQQTALRMSPQIRQAHLEVEAARGVALQAGLYPNPAIGYETAAIGQGNPEGQRTPGQQGGFVEQTIVTMGKLSLARHAASRDIEIAGQRLKATEADVQAQVRAGYFAVLASRETYRVTRAMTELTDELYNVLLLQLSVGEVAPYEPMQIRVLATQSRGTLVQAHNRYIAAWKQLAATLGTPGMPLTAIDGKIDMPVPHFEHDKVLAFVLANHTDMIAAQFGVERHRALVRLAELQPYPDVTVHLSFQKDFTTPP